MDTDFELKATEHGVNEMISFFDSDIRALIVGAEIPEMDDDGIQISASNISSISWSELVADFEGEPEESVVLSMWNVSGAMTTFSMKAGTTIKVHLYVYVYGMHSDPVSFGWKGSFGGITGFELQRLSHSDLFKLGHDVRGEDGP